MAAADRLMRLPCILMAGALLGCRGVPPDDYKPDREEPDPDWTGGCPKGSEPFVYEHDYKVQQNWTWRSGSIDLEFHLAAADISAKTGMSVAGVQEDFVAALAFWNSVGTRLSVSTPEATDGTELESGKTFADVDHTDLIIDVYSTTYETSAEDYAAAMWPKDTSNYLPGPASPVYENGDIGCRLSCDLGFYTVYPSDGVAVNYVSGLTTTGEQKSFRKNLIHEMGHCFGFGHPSDLPQSVMYEGGSTADFITPGPEDVGALHAMYGE